MPHVTPKIEVTWDNYTEDQIRQVRNKVLSRYPDAKFFIIVTNAEDVSKLILRHHDIVTIDNLVRAVNSAFLQL